MGRTNPSICDRDCFHCPYPDCILDQLDYEDYKALDDLDKSLTRTKEQDKAAAQKRAWYQANKDKKLARQRAWYQANKDRVAATHRAWYQANKDRILAQQRAYREANKDKILARQRAYREAKKKEGV